MVKWAYIGQNLTEIEQIMLKNDSFDKEKHNFKTKTVILQNLEFYIFCSSSVNF